MRRHGTGSVKCEKAKKRYKAVYQDENGNTHTKSFPLTAEGKQAANAYLDEIYYNKTHNITTAPAVTLKDAIKAYFQAEKQVRPNYRKTSQLRELQSASKLFPLYDTPIDAITEDDIRILYNKMRKGQKPYERKYSESSIKKVHNILLNIYKRACRGKHKLSYNPMEAVDPPTVRKTEAEFFTPEETKSFLKAVDTIQNNKYNNSPHNYAILFRLLLTEGFRYGEAVALRWEDIDFKNRLFRITRSWNKTVNEYYEPKTARGVRTVPIFSNTVFRWLKKNRQETGLLFPTRNGNPISYNCVRDTLKKAIAIAGLPPKKIHSMRHTAVSNWFAQGGTVTEVSEMAGHADIQTTTRVYQHMLNNNHAERLKKFKTK